MLQLVVNTQKIVADQHKVSIKTVLQTLKSLSNLSMLKLIIIIINVLIIALMLQIPNHIAYIDNVIMIMS